MIPKIIHYCWFGKQPLTENVKKCIYSWKKYCPEYKIIEWNEDNFDVNQNVYCQEAYSVKKWAFVSDFVRLKVLYEYGGIYLDTDVEIVKNMDNLLLHRFFAGLEAENIMSTAVIGAEQNSKVIAEFLSLYDAIHFIQDDDIYDYTTNVQRLSACVKNKYCRELVKPPIVLFKDAVIFDIDFFSVKNIYDGTIKISGNTYTIHHFAGSWFNQKMKIKTILRISIGKIFGTKIVKVIKKIIE